MSIDKIIDIIPDYAEDVVTELKRLLNGKKTALNNLELFTVAISVCYAIYNESLLNRVKSSARSYLLDIHDRACQYAVIYVSSTVSDNELYQEIQHKSLAHENILKCGEQSLSSFDLCCLAVAMARHYKVYQRLYKDKIIKKEGESSRDKINEIEYLVTMLLLAHTSIQLDAVISHKFSIS